MGNTLAFIDMEAVDAVLRTGDVTVGAAALARAEGAAKRRYEARIAAGGTHEDGWALFMRSLLTEAGLSEDAAREWVGPLRREHDRLNLWRRVEPSTFAALERARTLGLRLGVVSNSEGRLAELFAHLGLTGAFEAVVDSAHEGIRKPDPEIFLRALRRMGVRPEAALYAGDIPRVDVDGAHAAGMRAALIDPNDFFPEVDLGAARRFASVAELVDAIARAAEVA